jgi:hypothetical protein
VKRITVMFQGVSVSSTSNFLIQIGAGSVTTSGYSSAGWTTNTNTANSTAGFIMSGGGMLATYSWSGAATISSFGSNTWAFTSIIGVQSAGGTALGSGSIALGGTLDRVRITTVSGTDTFDAGSINILYE